MVNGGRNFILSWSVDPIQPTLVFSLYTILLCSSLLCCSARDNITFNNSLSDQRGETLVSAGERFELGFFTPDESSSSSTRYVGIWYHNLTPRTVVWVANRDSPLSDRDGFFEVTEGGNLVVLDGKGKSHWSTTLESSSFRDTTAMLVDSGNLVLISSASTKMILWESFLHPTDTFLPGMKMDEKLGLTSWKSRDDPSTGDFTFKRDQREAEQFIIPSTGDFTLKRDQREAEQFIITKKSTVGWYWWSDRDGFPNETTNLLLGIRSINGTDASTSCLPLPTRNKNPTNTCVAAIGPTVRLVMNFTGKIEHQTWDTDEKKWSLIWREPEVECDRFNFCGNFSICKSNNRRQAVCKCLPGFRSSEEFSGGCKRESTGCGKSDRFLRLNMAKVLKPDETVNAPKENECKDFCLVFCSCHAYSFDSSNTCSIWKNDLINLHEYADDGGDNLSHLHGDNLSHLHVRIRPKGHSLRNMLLVIAAVILLIALSCTVIYYSFLRRRRVVESQVSNENSRQNQTPRFYDSEKYVKNLIGSDKFREDDKKDIDVPFFDLESILAATDNFSDENKLGQGGFGPVYKGKFSGGQEIAIKRLSNVSRQGLEEFKNEVVLISKLQHRNLVRLLGYCIKGEEQMLLYEYMPNKSLDSFIFDRTLCAVLNWDLRFNIILGIARGLLYLHQDSRLRIIHRDLKTSNILLDEEMNPKISDFGLARIFGGKQIEASTNRVVGTYGYMSPEYALDGYFSIKSDIFSFGVVVLEIISGKRNTRFYQSKQASSLLGHAWRLWNEDKALDLMDQTLGETYNRCEFSKCVNVGLLCVQDDPSDRPTTENVVFMLGSETATLPTPKQPAFTVQRSPISTASPSTIPEGCSNMNLTVTVEEGR